MIYNYNKNGKGELKFLNHFIFILVIEKMI